MLLYNFLSIAWPNLYDEARKISEEWFIYSFTFSYLRANPSEGFEQDYDWHKGASVAKAAKGQVLYYLDMCSTFFFFKL